jgi:hypothetical protein
MLGVPLNTLGVVFCFLPVGIIWVVYFTLAKILPKSCFCSCVTTVCCYHLMLLLAIFFLFSFRLMLNYLMLSVLHLVFSVEEEAHEEAEEEAPKDEAEIQVG